jgi:hypothetical protein
MEFLGLLAIGVVLAFPVIAIVALVRSKTAERRVGEFEYMIADLRGDIAGLRRELVKVTERVTDLEGAGVAARTEGRGVRQAATPVKAVAAPAVAEELKIVPEPPLQTASLKSGLRRLSTLC